MTVPQKVWLVLIAQALLYEAWALVFKGYEYTLTAGARDAIAKCKWLDAVIVGFLAWLAFHITIQKKDKK